MSTKLENHLYPKGKSETEPLQMPSVVDNDGNVITYYSASRKTTESTVVNLGDAPNANNGDSLRTAFAKINNYIEAAYWANDSINAVLDSGFRISNRDFSTSSGLFGDADAITVSMTDLPVVRLVGEPGQVDVNIERSNLYPGDSEIVFKFGLSPNMTIEDLNIAGDATIDGNLYVNGATTTVNTENLTVKDSVISLNEGQINPTFGNDVGIVFSRYDSDNVSATNYNGYLVWDESNDKFVLGETSGPANDNDTDFGNVSKSYMDWAAGVFNRYDDAGTVRIRDTLNSLGGVSQTVSGDYTQAITGDYNLSANGDITLGFLGSRLNFRDTNSYWSFDSDASERLTLNHNATVAIAPTNNTFVLDGANDVTFNLSATFEMTVANDFAIRSSNGPLTVQTDDGDVILESNTKRVVIDSNVMIGPNANPTDAPFVFNTTTNTLTGDGTGSIDGGVF